MLQLTVGACRPVVEGWLTPLSSEKKNSFSLEHFDLDAEPGLSISLFHLVGTCFCST